MSNKKYKKDIPQTTASRLLIGKKAAIALIISLSIIILTLTVLLILDKTGILYNGKTPEGTVINPPVRADSELHEEGIYSYVLLTDGTVMIAGCAPEDGVTEINIPDSLGGFRVSAIGESCFALLTELKTLRIPEGVTYLGKNMLYGALNIRLYLPSTVEQVEINAFAGCETPDAIYFNGTKDEWSKVKIGSGNAVLDRVSFTK